jgi:hypothetical protein
MNYKYVIISAAKDLHHPGLCLVTFGDSPESTPPVQVFHPDRAKRVSGRGVFELQIQKINVNLKFNDN